MTVTIATATGLAVGGSSPASKAVETAMRSELLNGHDVGEDPTVTRQKLMSARSDAKPPKRR